MVYSERHFCKGIVVVERLKTKNVATFGPSSRSLISDIN